MHYMMNNQNTKYLEKIWYSTKGWYWCMSEDEKKNTIEPTFY